MRTCIEPSRRTREKRSSNELSVIVYSTLAMDKTRNGIMEKGVSMADDGIHYQLQFLPPSKQPLYSYPERRQFGPPLPGKCIIGCHGNQGYQLDDTSLSKRSPRNPVTSENKFTARHTRCTCVRSLMQSQYVIDSDLRDVTPSGCMKRLC